MTTNTRHRIIDGQWPTRLDPRTGLPGFRPFRHPRRAGKYRFAMVLQEWRRRQWTPDVVITRVARATGTDRAAA